MTALLGALAGRAAAGGFELYDQSPAATAMAGAVTAKADDPAAIFYNPAGIATRKGIAALAGGTLVLGGFRARTAGQTPIATDAAAGPTLLPQLFATASLGERFAVGIGLFPQAGAEVRWSPTGRRDGEPATPVPFPGRFLGQSTALQALTLNPSVAVRATDRIALGAGVDLVFGALDLSRALRIADAEGGVRLAGTAIGFGVNAGVLVAAVPRRLSVGLAYRSAVELPFALRARFDAPPELAGAIRDQTARASLTLPHTFTVALATFPSDRLTITTDLHYAQWSELSELPIRFPEGGLAPLPTPMRWRNAWSARAGAEYLVPAGPGALALRIGLGFDLTPVPAETLGPIAPWGDRLIASAGVGYTVRGFGASLGALLGHAADRTSANPAERSAYGGTLGTISFALSYRWEKKQK